MLFQRTANTYSNGNGTLLVIRAAPRPRIAMRKPTEPAGSHKRSPPPVPTGPLIGNKRSALR
ncbi:hypothetical protein Sp245p_28225 (plasmid) [Azospirillum baldaniorum]|uniref:Uncharacterized protein n=1 Tax=Azospirillum baldaniorum TaxID=1064539 RepID=A0A9P1NQC3_9PROT|nr:hypothetical protein Sp245p_28225 [Azospirillum baldaniorum]CCD01849.1 protein of unknown function [Azospirillum baldaniorum]